MDDQSLGGLQRLDWCLVQILLPARQPSPPSLILRFRLQTIFYLNCCRATSWPSLNRWIQAMQCSDSDRMTDIITKISTIFIDCFVTKVPTFQTPSRQTLFSSEVFSIAIYVHTWFFNFPQRPITYLGVRVLRLLSKLLIKHKGQLRPLNYVWFWRFNVANLLELSFPDLLL